MKHESNIVRKMIRENRAKIANPKQPTPSWHDAPTCAGIWICDEDDVPFTWTANNIKNLDQFYPEEGLRWYGPIPKDTK